MDNGRGLYQGSQYSNGKLVTRLEEARKNYWERVKSKREREEDERRDRQRELDRSKDMTVTWLGNEEDDPSKIKDDDPDRYRVYPNIPPEADWEDFLVRAGWTDEEVLNRQRMIWVHRKWLIYEFQVETGVLEPQGIF